MNVSTDAMDEFVNHALPDRFKSRFESPAARLRLRETLFGPARFEALQSQLWAINRQIELADAATLATGHKGRIEVWIARHDLSTGSPVLQPIECDCTHVSCDGGRIETDVWVDSRASEELTLGDCVAVIYYGAPRKRPGPGTPAVSDVVKGAIPLAICSFQPVGVLAQRAVRMHLTGERGGRLPLTTQDSANLRVIIVPVRRDVA
jgi:hypothetical protein